MNEREKFLHEKSENIRKMSADNAVRDLGIEFARATAEYKYSYNFEWMSRPIIQFPQDMIAMQELIWQVKPDLIIETGIAHGGSLVFYASILTLLDLCEANQKQNVFDLSSQSRKVLGIDIDIRKHNRIDIETHPMAPRIQMLEGSSVNPEIVEEVKQISLEYKKVMVCLDSNHTHDHVLQELEIYAPMTAIGSYCVVFDTLIEDMPDDMFSDRPWGKKNNPKTAVFEYLNSNQNFKLDNELENKLLLTVAPSGFLKRIS